MPWGELKKEDLIKAGLDPDAFKAASDKIATAASKDDITELKNALTETQNTLKNLETSFRQAATTRSDGDQNDDGNERRADQNNKQNQQQGPLKIDPLEFMEDPTGSVRKLTNEMLGPITMHSLNVASEMAYNMARQRLPYFEKFEPEIKELWNKYTPVQKQKPDELIENLYNLVRGRHLDEIITDSNKREGKYNLVQSGGTTVVGRVTGNQDQNRKPEDDLTPKELEVAARFGLSPKEWAEQKGNLKYV